MLGENSKKKQVHLAVLKKRKAYLGMQVEDLSKQYKELLKAKMEKEKEAELEARGKELEQMKSALK